MNYSKVLENTSEFIKSYWFYAMMAVGPVVSSRYYGRADAETLIDLSEIVLSVDITTMFLVLGIVGFFIGKNLLYEGVDRYLKVLAFSGKVVILSWVYSSFIKGGVMEYQDSQIILMFGMSVLFIFKIYFLMFIFTCLMIISRSVSNLRVGS